MLNILMVTMMFGAALPLLFPIAFVSYIILHIQDQVLLVYFACKPPNYDEKLNIKVMALMKIAPLYLLGFSFWQLTSQELIPYPGMK